MTVADVIADDGRTDGLGQGRRWSCRRRALQARSPGARRRRLTGVAVPEAALSRSMTHGAAGRNEPEAEIPEPGTLFAALSTLG